MAITQITTEILATSAVSTPKIADNAITAAKIPDGTIATGHIADNAVTAAKIPDNVLTATMLPDNVIAATHIPNATALTLDGGVTIDNITIDGTEIDLSSGDLTLDVAGDINLDAGGSDILLKVAGTSFASFRENSSDFRIKSEVSDKDILFMGNDGGSEITALTLNMSEAGTAYFNSWVRVNDSQKIVAGDSSDLTFYHDATNSYITNKTGALKIATETSGIAVTIGHSTSETTVADNLTVTGNSTVSGNLTIGSSIISESSSNLYISSVDGNNDMYFRNGSTLAMTIKGTNEHVRVAKAAMIEQVALVDGSTTWDSQAAANAYLLLEENTTIANPTNPYEGSIITVEVAQHASSGPYTLAWGNDFEFASSTAPTMTATDAKTDIFTFRYNGSVWQELGRVQNMAQT